MIALFLFYSAVWFGHASETTQPATTEEVPPLSACQKQMRDSECAEFFERHSIPKSHQRDCSAGIVQIAIEPMTACYKGFSKAVTDTMDGVAAMWNQLLQANFDRQRFTELMSECDREPGMECKRALAVFAGLTLNDKQLRSRAAITLHGYAQRRMRSQSNQIKLQEAGDFNSLPPDKKQHQIAEKRQQIVQQWKALENMIHRRLTDEGIHLACYNSAKANEALCYGFGMVVDPLFAATAAAKTARLSLGLLPRAPALTAAAEARLARMMEIAKKRNFAENDISRAVSESIQATTAEARSFKKDMNGFQMRASVEHNGSVLDIKVHSLLIQNMRQYGGRAQGLNQDFSKTIHGMFSGALKTAAKNPQISSVRISADVVNAHLAEMLRVHGATRSRDTWTLNISLPQMRRILNGTDP